MRRPLLPLLQHYVGARHRFHHLRDGALDRYQDGLARRVVAHAWNGSAFYREHWEGSDRSRWRELPVVDKARMMEHFDTYNTAGVSRSEAMEVALRAEEGRDFRPTLRGLTVGLSSGTSGHRGLFLVSPAEQAAWAGVVLARVLPGLGLRRYRVAFFLRSNSNLYTSLRSRWIDFRYFNLTQPLPETVEALNALAPELLAAPPSMLEFLAEERDRGRLRIRPEKVVSFAEVLEPQIRERLERSFDQPLHQVYQCTEGLLAITCARGSLHLQEDLVAFQMEPLPGEAERCVPVITDLWRRAQPMIRHRMNDVVVLEPRPCLCGSAFRVLRSIEGRADDVCYFWDEAGGNRAVFPDTIRRMVLLATPQIREYQAFQDGPGKLRLHLEPTPGASFREVEALVRGSVERVLSSHGCRPAQLQVEQGLVPVPRDAKLRRVRRLG